MALQKPRKVGLIADLWPNIRLMQMSGLFISVYHEDNSTLMRLVRKVYSWLVTTIVFAQFTFLVLYAFTQAYGSAEKTACFVTVLFFTHTLIKLMYVGGNSNEVYRILGMWSNPNTHPLFAESNARHRAIAISRMRKLLLFATGCTLFSVAAWITTTMLGDSVRAVHDPETENGTMLVESPRLPLDSWYPFDVMHGMPHIIAFALQVYFIFISLTIVNLSDSLFDSFVLVSCEQLKHLKEIMGPLIELSAALDSTVPNAEALFRVGSAGSKAPLIDENEDYDEYSNNYQNNRNNALSAISTIGGGTGPNGLSRKQEILVRSAIKYWVERHKHIVKYVSAIGDYYGLALLFHMLIATFTLTLLAYQATQINAPDKFAFSTIGFLVYSLTQIYMFCIYGNELIDESSSVMEAAYSCSWYDGSEEAKTFVQIVCQQCQKALSVTGAKFFTVSLDLFASVLGAVVTYFMVLIQLN